MAGAVGWVLLIGGPILLGHAHMHDILLMLLFAWALVGLWLVSDIALPDDDEF